MSLVKNLPNSKLDSKSANTRDLVMDSAERLFAEHGLNGVSVRDITHSAKVNLAAINYHFGGKAGLIRAVLERGMIPLNTKRLAALDAVQLAASPAHASLETILDAYMRPAVESAIDQTQSGVAFLKFMGRCFSEQGPVVEKCFLDCCGDMMRRFDEAWKWALPELSMDEIYWRISFTHGALNNWLLCLDRPVLGLVKAPGTLEEQLQRLIRFSSAGMRAAAINGK